MYLLIEGLRFWCKSMKGGSESGHPMLWNYGQSGTITFKQGVMLWTFTNQVITWFVGFYQLWSILSLSLENPHVTFNPLTHSVVRIIQEPPYIISIIVLSTNKIVTCCLWSVYIAHVYTIMSPALSRSILPSLMTLYPHPSLNLCCLSCDLSQSWISHWHIMSTLFILGSWVIISCIHTQPPLTKISDYQTINLSICLCCTFTTLLVEYGFFPTVPSQPNLAVLINFLKLYYAFLSRVLML